MFEGEYNWMDSISSLLSQTSLNLPDRRPQAFVLRVVKTGTSPLIVGDVGRWLSSDSSRRRWGYGRTTPMGFGTSVDEDSCQHHVPEEGVLYCAMIYWYAPVFPHVAVRLAPPKSVELWNSAMIAFIIPRGRVYPELSITLFSRRDLSLKLFVDRRFDTVTVGTTRYTIEIHRGTTVNCAH